MYLIQILLPLRDNKGKPFPASKFAGVQHELTEKFGGITAYVRSPAKGVWGDGAKVARDDHNHGGDGQKNQQALVEALPKQA